jgi:hypothetical protein
MKKSFLLLVFLTLFFILSCSSGGSSSGGGGGAAPSLLSFAINPTTARTSTVVASTVSFTYTDADGDLDGGSLVIHSNDDGTETSIALSSSFQGSTSGTGGGTFRFQTQARAGTYTYQIWLVDRRGNRSNIITGNFIVT